MILFPAIDIKDGFAVRLLRGEKYYVCVRTEGQCTVMRTCSNGFVVDIDAPQTGSVQIGNYVLYTYPFFFGTRLHMRVSVGVS